MSEANVLSIAKERLEYYPESGDFYWKDIEIDHPSKRYSNMWRSRYAGKRAGSIKGPSPGGIYYVAIKIQGVWVRAHRLAWAFMTGSFPNKEIDHVNGNGMDNRWSNLRSVTRGTNMQNKKLYSRNTSGCAGVTWRPIMGKWQSNITVKGKRIHLGLFAKKSDAIEARKEAELKNGFTKRHGTRCEPIKKESLR